MISTLYRRKLTILFTAIVMIFAAHLSHAAERKITKEVFPNGLTVILEEDHSAPVAAFQMWVRVGSADETKDEAGIAHVFEHMLFKGTTKRGLGDIAKQVESSGGYINAYTSFDNTVYHLAVASRYFDDGLDIISDAIQNSAFDPAELEKELVVVLEELNMNEDKPERKLYKTIFETAYKKHTYKKPVIGFKKTVTALSREKILDFFGRWYAPNNMTLVIVGDFDTTKAMAKVRTSFKNFERRPNQHKPRPVEPQQKSIRAVITPQPISQTRLAMAYHIPKLSHDDTYAIDALSNILGAGVTSRLYKRLKLDEELVNSVGSYAMTPKDPGLFLVTATLDAGRVKKASELITTEIIRLSSHGPTSSELARAKTSLESDFIYQRETMQGKARQLGYFETISGSLTFEKKYIDAIRTLTKKDIQKVAGIYLQASNMTISVIVPKKHKSFISKKRLVKAVKTAEKKARKKYAAKIKKQDVMKITLDNGVTLIIKEDHSNETVALYATVPGGLRYETPETSGIGNFTAAMLRRGTTNRSLEDIAVLLEDMAGGVSGFSGKNSTGVSAKFLSKDFSKGLDIFIDILLNPSFDDGELVKLRKDTLAAIKRAEDYLPGYTFKLLYQKLYPDHPYGMKTIGTHATVNSFTSEDLRKHYERVFLPKKMVITIVGDIDTTEAVEKLEKALIDLKRKGGETPTLKTDPAPTSIIKINDRKEKAQTNIGIGFMGVSIASNDKYAMSVLTEVLSSQGGRLFTELRDKLSLAYSVSAFSRPGVEPGLFGIYIGCSPDKKDRAIEGILVELRKITTEKVPDDELERAKSALIGGYEMGLQEVSSQASDMAINEMLGIGYDNYKKYAKNIGAVTADDVLKTAKRYLTLDGYVISIVGPNEEGL
jgi:zinc protease